MVFSRKTHTRSTVRHFPDFKCHPIDKRKSETNKGQYSRHYRTTVRDWLSARRAELIVSHSLLHVFQETERRSTQTLIIQPTRMPKSKLQSHAAERLLNRYWERRAPRATQERNLRSKIWWFTEFCNSHYVSHFAAFFIVARTKISIAKSCIF